MWLRPRKNNAMVVFFFFFVPTFMKKFAEISSVTQAKEKTVRMFNSKERSNMEEKIGETFEFEGKTYKVVKFNGCGNCAFRYNYCPDL